MIARRRSGRIVRLTVAVVVSTLLVNCAASRGTGIGRVPLARAERVEVEEGRLFLQVRGEDREAPVLLWLHGGPGGAERPLFRYFNAALERQFVVAYWDQRGAGRSFDPRADPARLTVAQHVTDLDAVVDHLTRTLDRDRIVLVGHSWGAALGLLYASTRPQKVAAFIGVNPLVSAAEAQRTQYEFVLREASSRGDRTALGRLREIGRPPFEATERLLALERLVERYGGVFHRPPGRFRVAVQLILRGLVTPWEIRRLIRANVLSLDAMLDELLTLDLTRRVLRVDVPVFFFLGRHDRHTEAALAAAYFWDLQAPTKRLIWFEHSAHNVPFEEPALFNVQVAEAVGSISPSPDALPDRVW
jgi:proline iminopeptidase